MDNNIIIPQGSLGKILSILNQIDATAYASIAAWIAADSPADPADIQRGDIVILSDNTAWIYDGTSSGGAVAEADFTPINLDNNKVSKTGDSMSGNLDMGANKVTSSADPTVDNDLTRKAYVDTELDTLDGRTLESGDFTANEYTVQASDIGQVIELKNGADAQININPNLFKDGSRGKFLTFWNDDGFTYTFVASSGIVVSEGDTGGAVPVGDGKNKSTKAHTPVTIVGSTDGSLQVKLFGKISA